MTLEEFEKQSSEFDFYKRQKVLDLTNEDEVYKFYDLRYKDCHKYYYAANPIYNYLSKSKNTKYIVIDIDDDSVMLVYKVILMGTVQQIRIIDRPISFLGNKENENKILTIVLKNKFIKWLYKDVDDYVISNGILEKSEISEHSCDYFMAAEQLEERFNGRFRKHHNINKILANSDYRIELRDTIMQIEAAGLRAEWKSKKADSGSVMVDREDKKYFNFLQSSNENIKHVCIYYKDNLISVETFILSNDKSFAEGIFRVHLGRSKTDDETLNLAYSHMSQIQDYFAYKMLNVKRMYFQGCRLGENKLLLHKERVSSGKDTYYLYGPKDR